MYIITYNNEIIDYAETTEQACELSIVWRLNPIMYGISEVNNMLHYIKEDGLCVYVTHNVADVNDWLAKHGKNIKRIYTTNYNETIVEV